MSEPIQNLSSIEALMVWNISGCLSLYCVTTIHCEYKGDDLDFEGLCQRSEENEPQSKSIVRLPFVNLGLVQIINQT